MSDAAGRGRVYTPVPVAEALVEAAARAVSADERRRSEPLLVLDPACGAGSLLAAAARAWPSARLYGVDIDAAAVADAARALPDDSRLLVGNALTGPSFRDGVESGFSAQFVGTGGGDDCVRGRRQSLMVRTADPTNREDEVAWRQDGTDWRRAFPEVAERGGFDVVIANPPYVRERGAKAWFDEVAATPLGQTWRRPRMDLWHYFFHRGLELLAPGGVMALIVPSYFATAASGAALRKRMGEETRLIELLDFADLPIFPGVQGRHLIMTVRLGHADPGEPVRLWWPQRSGRVIARDAMDLEVIVDDLRRSASSGGVGETVGSWSTATVPHRDVLSDGRLALRPVTGRACGALSGGRTGTADQLRLGDLFDVRQGIAENPPRLTRTQAEQLGDGYHEGMGVFVLDAGEVDQLDLSEAERAVLRPYYLPREIGRYRLPNVSTLSLLYLTRETSPDVTAMPAIERHLSRFRSILSERREVRLGKSAWWHLHWPRKERLFTRPRILAPQMVRRPVFVCELTRPTFVNFSVNVIAPPGDVVRRNRLREVVGLDDERLGLQAACGVLNSQATEEWLARNAKQRGAALDVSGGMLRQIPWPRLAPREWADVARLAAECGNVTRAGGETRDLESEIDRLIRPSVPNG